MWLAGMNSNLKRAFLVKTLQMLISSIETWIRRCQNPYEHQKDLQAPFLIRLTFFTNCRAEGIPVVLRHILGLTWQEHAAMGIYLA